MFLSPPQIISLLEIYKYLILFPIVVVEGPIITIIAAFLSSLGYLNVYLVYITVVIGDVAGDCIYYAFGRFGGRKFIDRWGKYLGISAQHVTKLESLFTNHGKKTLIIGKLTHAIGGVILISAGIAKFPIRDFIIYNFIPTFPKSLLLILIGYFFGEGYKQLNKGLNYLSIATFLILGVLLLTYLSFKFLSKKFLPKQ